MLAPAAPRPADPRDTTRDATRPRGCTTVRAPSAGLLGRNRPTSIRPSRNASVCRMVVTVSRSSTTSGYACRNEPSNRGSTSNVADWTNRNRNVPSSPRCVRCAVRTASSDRRNRSCASARNVSPAAVSTNRRSHPGEQFDAQIALERRDLPAERRLGEMQPGRGAADVHLLGHHHERPELAEFHPPIMHQTHQLCEELSLDVSRCAIPTCRSVERNSPCNYIPFSMVKAIHEQNPLRHAERAGRPACPAAPTPAPDPRRTTLAAKPARTNGDRAASPR